jgi:hypothetical protein
MNEKILSFISVVLCFIFTTPSHANAILTITPGTQSVSAGSPVSFAVNISGLGSGIALGAYVLDIGFDSALLNFSQATFGDPVLGDQLDLLKTGSNAPSATPSLGNIKLIEFSLDDSATLIAQQARQFTLTTLSFTSLTQGTSPLTLSVDSLTDANANDLQSSIVNGSVTINGSLNTVFEPEALLLLMIGGLAFLLKQIRNCFV